MQSDNSRNGSEVPAMSIDAIRKIRDLVDGGIDIETATKLVQNRISKGTDLGQITPPSK